MHFTSKKMYEEACRNLFMVKLVESVGIAANFCALAHLMAPRNMDVLSSLAQSLLQCGKHKEALNCAEIVLQEVGLKTERSHVIIFLK